MFCRNVVIQMFTKKFFDSDLRVYSILFDETCGSYIFIQYTVRESIKLIYILGDDPQNYEISNFGFV